MIKQTIKYDDFDGHEVVEDFYFNLTKLELMEMEAAYEGGLQTHIEKLTKTEDGPQAYYLFKDIVLASYGKKSEDGRRFIKKNEHGKLYRDEFEESPALGELILGFMQNPESSADFVKGLMPAKLIAEAEKEMSKQKPTEDVKLPEQDATVHSITQVPPPNKEKDISLYSREELLKMPQEEFDKLAGKDPTKMDKDVLVVAMQRKSQS